MANKIISKEKGKAYQQIRFVSTFGKGKKNEPKTKEKPTKTK